MLLMQVLPDAFRGEKKSDVPSALRIPVKYNPLNR
jgi:hypothetical protein